MCGCWRIPCGCGRIMDVGLFSVWVSGNCMRECGQILCGNDRMRCVDVGESYVWMWEEFCV